MIHNTNWASVAVEDVNAKLPIIHALNWAKRSPHRQPRMGMIELLSPPPRLPGASHLVSGEIMIFLVQEAPENEFFRGYVCV